VSSPFVAEIRAWACTFAPSGWAQCNGQILPISQNTALFSLIGTYYGGNGTSTFALPNLQNAVPVNQGQGQGLSVYFLGESDGFSSVSLPPSQIPAHTHSANAFQGRGKPGHPIPAAGDSLTVTVGDEPIYTSPSNGVNVVMSPQTAGSAGGGLAHNNVMPSLALNYCIALQGIYPQRQ
jgi:microcystin-dependent protein